MAGFADSAAGQNVAAVLFADDILLKDFYCSWDKDLRRKSKNRYNLYKDLNDRLIGKGFCRLPGEFYGISDPKEHTIYRVYEKNDNDALYRVILTSRPELAKRVLVKHGDKDCLCGEDCLRGENLYAPNIIAAFLDHYFVSPKRTYDDLFVPSVMGDGSGDLSMRAMASIASNMMVQNNGKIGRELASMAIMRDDVRKVFCVTESGGEAMRRRVLEDVATVSDVNYSGKIEALITENGGKKEGPLIIGKMFECFREFAVARSGPDGPGQKLGPGCRFDSLGV